MGIKKVVGGPAILVIPTMLAWMGSESTQGQKLLG